MRTSSPAGAWIASVLVVFGLTACASLPHRSDSEASTQPAKGQATTPGEQMGTELSRTLTEVSPEAPADGDRDSVDESVLALIDQLTEKASRNEARSRIQALGRAATSTLLTRWDDPDERIRWEMANIQGTVRDPRALPGLVSYVLRDESPHVRWRSIWAIRQHGDKSRALELFREASSEVDPVVRWNAAVGLSTLGAEDCLPAIHAGLKDKNGWRRWEAVNALGRIHDESSATLLAPIIARDETKHRTEAAMVLGDIGGLAAVDLLIGALSDDESRVRWRAARALGKIGDTKAIEALETLLEKETESSVLDHARPALALLTQALEKASTE